MKCQYAELNEYTKKALSSYNSWRENCQLISNYLMTIFQNWQVYMVEHDRDVLCMHFCSRIDRMNDTSFLITKEQLEHLSHTIECSIIPAIVAIEEDFFGSCECQK